MKFDRVLVGIDFSNRDLAAIDHARALARQGHVELVHVLRQDRFPRPPLFDDALAERMVAAVEADARRALAELAREVASEGVRISTELLVGRPADEILRAARSADFVVLGSASKSLSERFELGSIAEEVVRRSEVPVLVVRDKAEGSTQMARVLVAVDLDDPCPEALEAASALASRAGARLEALHVVSTPIPTALRFIEGVPEDLEARVRLAAEKAVRSFVSTTLGANTAIAIAFGSPAEEIAKLARRDDLIVVGTHGRGTLGRLVFGSVATKLLRTAPCPVLTVRPQDGVSGRTTNELAETPH